MKKSTILCSVFVSILAFLVLTPAPVHAAPITDVPVTVTQPNGVTLHLFASGDEYYNWLHDVNGYTIIQDPVTGYYVYADLTNGELFPTKFVVGETDPASKGLRPYINISPAQKEEIRQSFLDQTLQAAGETDVAPHSGTMTNLVVFIRFSDEPEFTDLTSKYTDMLNNSTVGAASLRNYYREVSYNALTIDSLLFPTPVETILSYQDSHPRAYYQPYNAVTNPVGYTNDRGPREHTLLRDALNYVNGLGQFPSGATIDANGDGQVDSLTFVIQGSPGGWNELLWPHAWGLYSYTVTIDGKLVKDYELQLQTMINTGVLAHETFHLLGAPDLYHYSSTGTPVGNWDVMSNQTNPPQQMSCYMKYKYGGWISDIPEIPYTTPAAYSLNPLTSQTNNCKKVASPYSTTEFFVVEYRSTGAGSTFESKLPGTGLLVYRINTLAQGNGNGPPDEVYIYRPSNVVTQANFSSTVGRTAINDSTNPSSVLSNGGPGGLNLCNIGAPGTTISFNVCLPPSFTISGNAGVGGATLSYLDGTFKTVRADGNGTYSLPVSPGWSGTVIASKTGFTFSPASRSYTDVFFNRAAQDYAASGPANLLQDPGFEGFVPGTPHPNWTETSTNFGTPLCSTASSGCANTSTAKPQTGSAWGRFGYTAGNETASLSQTVNIPTGTAFLEFYFWIGYAQYGSDVNDLFTVKIDDVPVFSANATQSASYPGYTFVSLDVSPYADDFPHTILFSSVTTSQFVIFNLDNVALYSIPKPPEAFDKTSPTNGAANQSISPTLIWEPSKGATSYEYCYDTTNDNACANWVGNGSSTSKTIDGLNQNTTYYWHVRARNSAGVTYSDGSPTNFRAFTTQILDNTHPVVSSIIKTGMNPATTTTIEFKVLFSEPVTGLTIDDFSLFTSGITNASIAGVNSSGNTGIVTVNTGSGNGTIRLDIPATADVHDLDGNSLEGLPYSSGELYIMIKTPTYNDVRADYWAWSFIERLYSAGITSGCTSSPMLYCPTAAVTRDQMAIFLLRGKHTSSHTPPKATGVFGDVPPDYWAADWIEQLLAEEITSGCGNGHYCPTAPVTRDQMAVFLLRAKHGSDYVPTDAKGIFEDVPPDYWAADWIEQLAAEGITSGCKEMPKMYCPTMPVTRDQMAVFLVRNFDLP